VRRLIPLLTLALIAATAVTTASARNPGGRNFPGATFSAGVSGDDSVTTSTAAAPGSPLGALVRVSDDVSSTVGPTPPGQSGQVFLFSEVEPWVVVNPGNPKNVVGAFQEDRWSSGGARNNVAATSFDGGKTWLNQAIPGVTVASGGTYQRNTDPWVDFGPGNRVYAASLPFDDQTFRSGLFVSTSTDGGKAWGAPVPVITETEFQFFNDKDALAADSGVASPFRGNVYVTWDRLIESASGQPVTGTFTGPAMLSRSADGGATFSTPQVIFDTGTNKQTIGNVPVVLPDGTVVVGGTYIESLGAEKKHSSFFVVRSTDGGVTFSAPQIVDDEQALVVPGLRTGDLVPSLAVDRRTGRIYAAWQDSRFSKGKRDDILVTHSDDAGATWSMPLKANDTPAGAQDAFLPAVQVDSHGQAAILYDDLRDDPSAKDGQFLTAAWLTTSTDGQTWSVSTRVSPTFDQAASPNAGGFFLGDYQGLGVAGTQFQPFFSADLLTQQDGKLGSDIFSTRLG
jgi:BNR repeat-like domain